jgi:hypothetical protein
LAVRTIEASMDDLSANVQQLAGHADIRTTQLCAATRHDAHLGVRHGWKVPPRRKSAARRIRSRFGSAVDAIKKSRRRLV